jgi:hypothetical protein
MDDYCTGRLQLPSSNRQTASESGEEGKNDYDKHRGIFFERTALVSRRGEMQWKEERDVVGKEEEAGVGSVWVGDGIERTQK